MGISAETAHYILHDEDINFYSKPKRVFHGRTGSCGGQVESITFATYVNKLGSKHLKKKLHANHYHS